MKKTTIREFNEILPLLNKVPADSQTKLGYAIKKITAQFKQAVKPFQDNLQETLSDFRVNHAEVDDKGILKVDNPGTPQERYYFTKENTILVSKETRRVNDQFLDTEIELAGYIIDDVTEAKLEADKIFDEYDREQLAGILFDGPKPLKSVK